MKINKNIKRKLLLTFPLLLTIIFTSCPLYEKFDENSSTLHLDNATDEIIYAKSYFIVGKDKNQIEYIDSSDWNRIEPGDTLREYIYWPTEFREARHPICYSAIAVFTQDNWNQKVQSDNVNLNLADTIYYCIYRESIRYNFNIFVSYTGKKQQ